MARQSARKRRSFGKCKPIVKHGRKYLEYSYPTPPEAFASWPDLPARCYKIVPPEDEWAGEAWLSAARLAIKAGAWRPPQVEKAEAERDAITFREYAEQWLKGRKRADGTPIKPTSAQKYRESLDLYLLPAFGRMPLSKITPKDVERWWDGFKPLRPDADAGNRRAHVYRHLKTIMNAAATEPLDNEGHTLIPSSPCRIRAPKPKTKHVPVRPTPEQLQALLAALPDYVRPVALICDRAGLREGEALGLCVKHIDFSRMKITVAQQVQRIRDPKNANRYVTAITTPKTATSTGEVSMSPELARALREWMDSQQLADPDARLFTGRRTQTWITPQTYRNAFADARRKVPGLENMRPHDLRKDCLSTILDEGGTVAEAMRQGRHTTMAVASKYQIVSDEHMNGVMNRIDARNTTASAGTDRRDGGNMPADGTSTALQVPDAVPVAAAHGTNPPAQPRGDTGDDAEELRALAGVLAALPLSERVNVLRSLPVDRRAAAVAVLPEGAKAETLAELLKT